MNRGRRRFLQLAGAVMAAQDFTDRRIFALIEARIGAGADERTIA